MRKLLTIVAAAALLCTGCEGLTDIIGTDPDKLLQDIKFTGKVETWGTERALETGDQVGLFASAPISENNVLLTVGDFGSLVAIKEMKWKIDSTISSVSFLAYTPYSSNYHNHNVTFTAKADQTNADAVKASDLMIAKVEAKMPASSVDFTFSHKMVRIAIYLDNRSGKEIQSVSVGKISLNAALDLSEGKVAAADSAGSATVKLGKYSKSGAEYYAAIVAPQTCNPVIKVTLSDGSVKEYPYSDRLAVESGQQWDNARQPIVIEGSGSSEEVPAAFTFDISNWDEGAPLPFSRK